MHGFTRDGCPDLAAALAFHTLLAAAPALLALVSVVGLFGQADRTVAVLLGLIAPLAPGTDLERTAAPVLEGLARSPAAPLTFTAGVAGALWSASGYTAAFARAMDRVWGRVEDRPYARLRGELLVLTLVLLVLASAGSLLAVVPAEALRAVAGPLGLSDAVVAVYAVVKWPLLVGFAVLAVSLLYFWTPDVRPEGLRLVSGGAVVALVLWAAASTGLAGWVSGFGRYQATYGSIGTLIVLLVWLWLSNLSLLLGARLDAEVERMRQLLRGEPSEAAIRVPERDPRAAARAAQRLARDEAVDRAIRRAAEQRRREDATDPPREPG